MGIEIGNPIVRSRVGSWLRDGAVHAGQGWQAEYSGRLSLDEHGEHGAPTLSRWSGASSGPS